MSQGFSISPRFDPLYASIGGLLIGASTTFYLVMTGRTAGLSSIAEGFVTLDRETWTFKSAFMAGLASGVLALAVTTGTKFVGTGDLHFDELAPGLLVFAGFMVGFGTRFGNGCTSGHGVCGMSRRSPRSIASVLVFLTTAIATATIHSIITGEALKEQEMGIVERNPIKDEVLISGGVVSAGLLGLSLFRSKNRWRDTLASYASGFIFSLGLCLSGMVQPTKVVDFLRIGPNWDPSLLFVLGSAVGFNLISFELTHSKMTSPLLHYVWPEHHEDERQFQLPSNVSLDFKLIFGAWVFGIGWGLTGVCPGPGILIAVSGFYGALFLIPAMGVGMVLGSKARNSMNDHIISPIVPKQKKDLVETEKTPTYQSNQESQGSRNSANSGVVAMQ